MLALLAPALLLLQTAPPQLAPDAEARWVAFELTPYNQIRFAATLGDWTIPAILDTGLSDTMVTQAFATQAGIEPRRWSEALAIGGGVPVSWAESPAIRLGALSRSGGRIGVVRSREATRLGAQLLVGRDLLDCCALDIDYPTRRFRLLPSGRMPFTGVTLPLARVGPAGASAVTLRLGERTIAPVMIDTGDGAALTLSPEAWRTLGYRGLTSTTLGWGAGGASVTDLAVLPGFALEREPPVEVEIRIEDGRGFLAKSALAGRLGNNVLMRFRVLVDPAAGRVVLRSDPNADTRIPRSTAGLLLEHAGDRFTVLHVMRGSPAAAGGWKAGEQICAADGVPVARTVNARVVADWTTGTPGRTVALTLCDGSRRTLRLARFY